MSDTGSVTVLDYLGNPIHVGDTVFIPHGGIPEKGTIAKITSKKIDINCPDIYNWRSGVSSPTSSWFGRRLYRDNQNILKDFTEDSSGKIEYCVLVRYKHYGRNEFVIGKIIDRRSKGSYIIQLSDGSRVTRLERNAIRLSEYQFPMEMRVLWDLSQN